MYTSRVVLAAISAAVTANAASYAIADSFDSTNFFEDFSFFTDADPTGGFVTYTAPEIATSNATGSLAQISNGAVYMGVDSTTVNPPNGRGSVRVSSNKAYNQGLFIADIAHMPGSICGVWPAFWTFGPDWPASGEIDIIEGVNDATTDAITLHTSEGCTMSSTGSLSSSNLTGTDCGANNGDDGCSFDTASTQGYGDGFNAIGGGVYAMDWTSTAIEVWFFPRTSIPTDIASGSPDPSTWGTPTASFSGSGCDIGTHFKNHNIVFDTTFCGQWAGQVWTTDSCASKAATCDDYVAQNPLAFIEAYWLVNSMKVYQDNTNTTVTRRENNKPRVFVA